MEETATTPDRPASRPEQHSASIAELLSDWLSTTGDRVSAVTRLAMAEARLAAISVALMAFLALLAALFVFAAWGLGIAGVVHFFLDLGVTLWLVLLAIAVIHVGGAVLLWSAAMRLGRHVEFRATQQQLFESVEESQ